MAAKSGFTRKIFIIRTHSTVLLHQETPRNTVGELNESRQDRRIRYAGNQRTGYCYETFKNPLGKKNEKDICIISIREVAGNGLCRHRQVNDSDVLYLLKTNDYPSIVEETVRQIKGDFGRISGIFSINCIFRYLSSSPRNVIWIIFKNNGNTMQVWLALENTTTASL